MVFAALGGLTLILFNTQVIQGSHYRDLSERNRVRLERVQAPRGNVYDRKGALLAANRPSYNVYIVPEDFSEESIGYLAEVLQIPADGIQRKLKDRKTAAFVPILLKRDVSRDVFFRIEEKRPGLSGVSTEVVGKRYYPQEKTGSHVVGYLGKITSREYKNQEDAIYHRNDWMGRSGIEQSFNQKLRGEDGGRQIEVNAVGRHLRVLSEKKPIAGKDFTLTIDTQLQRRIAEAFEGRKGSAVLLDVKTGEIVSMVSMPEYDPNVFVSPAQSVERLEVLKDSENIPLLNRASNAAYPPGSVFKLVTALAALDSGKINVRTKVNCTGSFKPGPRARAFKCWEHRGHGLVNLEQAIERSCNVFFYKTSMEVGANRIARFAEKLGLGSAVRFELPSMIRGLIPNEEWKWKQYHEKWYTGETLNMAIGQGFVMSTPLQLARLIGVIANEGYMPPIHLVRGQAENGKPLKTKISKGRIRLIKNGMRRVVYSKRGTGKHVRVDFVSIAGKTGTAQAGEAAPHAWFSGFFPYEDPQYALVVFIEHGGSGGYFAAKLAREIVISMKELNYFGAAAHAL